MNIPRRIYYGLLVTAVIGFVCAPLALLPGCATSKEVNASTNVLTGTVTFTTNTVLNPAGLLVDTAIAQSTTALAVSVAVQKDPSIVPILKDTQTALNGVISGANTNSTSQVLQVLGQSANPTLAAEVTPLVQTISALEQNLIAKYGASVGGQITIAIAKAVLSGLTVGLAGK